MKKVFFSTCMLGGYIGIVFMENKFVGFGLLLLNGFYLIDLAIRESK